MTRRIVTFLVVMFVTAAVSTWWLYEGNIAAVAPLGDASAEP